jgi:cell division protein FtsZ
VTTPFGFEGKKRRDQGERGLDELRESADTVITIPNQRLLGTVPQGTSLFEAFHYADDVLRQAVQGISDLITVPGIINLDFADVKTIMAGMGMALMGTGVADGEDRAVTAAKRAISSPLLEDTTIDGAKGVLINVTGNRAMTLHEVSEASRIIQEAAHRDAHIIFGSVCDDSIGNQLKITVIATGFEDDEPNPEEESAVEFPDLAMQRTRFDEQTMDQSLDSMSHAPEPDMLEIPTFIRRRAER